MTTFAIELDFYVNKIIIICYILDYIAHKNNKIVQLAHSYRSSPTLGVKRENSSLTILLSLSVSPPRRETPTISPGTTPITTPYDHTHSPLSATPTHRVPPSQLRNAEPYFCMCSGRVFQI